MRWKLVPNVYNNNGHGNSHMKAKLHLCNFRDLGNNDLEEIPKGLFSTNPNGHLMTSLLLCGNKLNTLPKGLFDNLHYLQNL